MRITARNCILCAFLPAILLVFQGKAGAKVTHLWGNTARGALSLALRLCHGGTGRVPGRPVAQKTRHLFPFTSIGGVSQTLCGKPKKVCSRGLTPGQWILCRLAGNLRTAKQAVRSSLAIWFLHHQAFFDSYLPSFLWAHKLHKSSCKASSPKQKI